MRPNIRVHEPDVLHRAQLLRGIQMRQMPVLHDEEYAIDVLAYLVVAGIVWSFVAIVFFLW